jgi:hypothetical protein
MPFYVLLRSAPSMSPAAGGSGRNVYHIIERDPRTFATKAEAEAAARDIATSEQRWRVIEGEDFETARAAWQSTQSAEIHQQIAEGGSYDPNSGWEV